MSMIMEELKIIPEKGGNVIIHEIDSNDRRGGRPVAPTCIQKIFACLPIFDYF